MTRVWRWKCKIRLYEGIQIQRLCSDIIPQFVTGAQLPYPDYGSRGSHCMEHHCTARLFLRNIFVATIFECIYTYLCKDECGKTRRGAESGVLISPELAMLNLVFVYFLLSVHEFDPHFGYLARDSEEDRCHVLRAAGIPHTQHPINIRAKSLFPHPTTRLRFIFSRAF